MMILCNVYIQSLQNLMVFQYTYKKESCQLISKEKGYFIVGDKTDSAMCHIIEEVIVFQKITCPSNIWVAHSL